MRSLVTDDLKVMLAGNDLTGGVVPAGAPQVAVVRSLAANWSRNGR